MTESAELFTFRPIGYLHGGGAYPYEAPRQGVMAENSGVITLLPDCGFESALEDLAGFDYIWVVFVFDRNAGHWKPKVAPPENPGNRKLGVFATRAPYRPNPIGISAVRLERVEGRNVYIRNFDLLENTPILDLKPYIPVADAFPEAAAGWRDELPELVRRIQISPEARRRIQWLADHGNLDLTRSIRTQLETRTLDPKRQRLRIFPDGTHVLSIRTWRIVFRRNGEELSVERVFSGYSAQERVSGSDVYMDKELHRKFFEEFGGDGSGNEL